MVIRSILAGELAQNSHAFLKFHHNSGSDILIGGQKFGDDCSFITAAAPQQSSQRPHCSKPWRTLSIVNRE